MSKYQLLIINTIYSERSYEDIDLWLKDLKTNSCPDIKIFLIGNKVDLENERVVPKEKAENLKNEYGLDFFMETSAKSGLNTEELFAEAAKLLFKDYRQYKDKKNKREGEKLKPVDVKEPAQKKKCC